MCGNDTREELTLTAAEGTCSCCTTTADTVVPENAPEAASGPRFELEGLTCGHCVQTVEQAVSALDGVDRATVDLVAGGTSTLTVTGTVDEASVRDAVTKAGYTVSVG